MPKLLLFLLLVAVGILCLAFWEFVGWTLFGFLLFGAISYGIWKDPPKIEFNYRVPRWR